MPSKYTIARYKAFFYTRHIYRDIEALENAPSQEVVMDSGLYDDVKRALSDRLISERHYLGDELTDTESQVITYIMFGINGWDKPKRCTDKYDGSDIAEYLLRGKFKDGCENGHKLTNDEMRIVNADVYNRAYALALDGII